MLACCFDQDNGEALHKAIQGDDTRMVQTLIALGANVNQQHERWGIPLARAAERGNVEIVSYLLDHGATQYDQAVDKATRSNRIAVLQALKGRGVDTTPTAAAITAALQVKYAAAVLYHMADGHELTEQQAMDTLQEPTPRHPRRPSTDLLHPLRKSTLNTP